MADFLMTACHRTAMILGYALAGFIVFAMARHAGQIGKLYWR